MILLHPMKYIQISIYRVRGNNWLSLVRNIIDMVASFTFTTDGIIIQNQKGMKLRFYQKHLPYLIHGRTARNKMCKLHYIYYSPTQQIFKPLKRTKEIQFPCQGTSVTSNSNHRGYELVYTNLFQLNK